ncbi:MAG TPA: glycosyltransferase [Candidatus Omnitrophota bacterium]|nr:glycosyltransferase [Candidatus Omnitrophota bacterium]HRZ14107.1 glycosyltransferase [Candidatus Omnitrophota bacterium]
MKHFKESLVAVVIPIKNEEKVARDLLERLKSQSLLINEIVIVDGGSRDNTMSIINEYKDSLPVKLLSVSCALPGRGRNVAIDSARCELIVSTDAGCTFDNFFVEEMVRPFFEDPSVDVVYGIRLPDGKTIFEKCSVAVFYPIQLWPYVACMAFKKYVWERVGGYPETLRTAEDYLFIKKIEKAGFKTVINEKAKIYWRPRSTIGAFFKQYYQYAKGKGQVKVDLIFHLRKLALYFAILLFCTLSFIFNTIIWGGGGCVVFILWIGLTVKNHWKWFVEIKSIPQAYFLLPIVVLVRDWAALLGFFVGWIQGTKENVEID